MTNDVSQAAASSLEADEKTSTAIDHAPGRLRRGVAGALARTLERATSSPLRLLLATLAAVFVSETFSRWILMFGLMPRQLGFASDFLDTGIMAFLSVAFAWWLMARRRRNEKLVRSHEQHFRALIENALDITWTAGTDAKFAYANPSVERTLGYKPEEFIGSAAADFIHPDDLPKVAAAIAQTLSRRGPGPLLEVRVRHRDGSWHTLEAIGSAFFDVGEGPLSVINARDITQRKRAEDELRTLHQELEAERQQVQALNRSLEKKVRERTQDLRLANEELKERNRQLLDVRAQAATDALTSLPNHRAFQERVRDAVSRAAAGGSSVGLIMLDIDGFKGFNDSLGHQAGDDVLRHCSRIFVETLGTDYAYRYGGDEFVVILPGVDEQRTADMAERLRSAVAAEFGGHGPGLTVSLGVAAFPSTAASTEELIYKADAAMYLAKSAGKNRVARWEEKADPYSGSSQPVQTASRRR
jgi:diguanylate cyclase (GGDEF)-like protein/PAS domain S-box-containing protein